jgi:exonuclease SbcC
MARIPTPETIAALDQQLQEIRGGLATAAAEAEERRTAWVRDAQDAKTKRETLLDQYQELKEQHQRIVDAGPAGVCPTCARPLGDEFDNVLGVLERQLQDVMFNGQFYKQRIEQLVIDPPELTALEQKRAQLEREAGETTARLVRLQAQAQDAPGLLLERARQESRIRELEERLARMQTTYDQARHREVRRLLDELEPLALQGERLRAAADRGEVLIREAEVAEKELSDREAAGGALRNRMATLGFSEESLRETRATFDRSEQGRREAELALVRARAEREAAEEARQSVARRRAERAAREEEARRTARDLELHNELDRALGDLRTDLNAQLRPDLSEIASAFLRELTNGRYNELDLDEDYVATIMDEGEPKPVISGGEEDISSLALRLAISQMIAERAGQPLSLLILDEVFGSLDEDHRQSVVDLLRSLADRFPQVILITHIESVRDGFDRVIRVEFDREKGTAMVRDEATGGVDGLAA